MKSIAFTARVYDLPYVAEVSQIDLRANPAKIDELPELLYEPRLKPLVKVLNENVFMTLGCAVAPRKPGIEGGTPITIPYGAKDAPRWYSSYVIFALWHLSQNKDSHYRTFYNRYPSDRNRYNIAFEIQPAYFCTPLEQQIGEKYLDSNGTVCSVWISGWGTSMNEAQKRWSEGVGDAIAFFADTLNQVEPGPGPTLSQYMFSS